jgi:hypothetical protein
VVRKLSAPEEELPCERGAWIFKESNTGEIEQKNPLWRLARFALIISKHKETEATMAQTGGVRHPLLVLMNTANNKQKEQHENDQIKKLDGCFCGCFDGDRGFPRVGRPGGDGCQTGKNLHGHGDAR